VTRISWLSVGWERDIDREIRVPTIRAAVLAIACIAAIVSPVHAAGVERVIYETPINPDHEPIHDRLKSQRWLERMHDVLSRYRMPGPVSLRLGNCRGAVEAWYYDRQITVCYGYLAVLQRRAMASQLTDGVSLDDAFAGAFAEVVFHEFGHALFESHKMPLLGREEDAADQMAAYMLVTFGGADGPRLVAGAAQVYLSWMAWQQNRPATQLRSGASRRDANTHTQPAQRLYNLVCLAYGSNEAAYTALAKTLDLPEDRASDCGDEFAQVRHAYTTLVKPHESETTASAAAALLRDLLVR
jgi:hypothetical protein